jgi:hypothetical protein
VLVEVERLPRGERRRQPRVLWLWWHGEGEPDLGLLWRAYIRRFDLEHTFRFLKQTLGWTAPRVRHPEQADRWTWLVVTAFTQLRLARPCACDRRLPWERRYDPGRLTPVRVRRVVLALLADSAHLLSRQNLADAHRDAPKAACRDEPDATRPSRRPLKPAKTANARVLRCT